MKPKNKATSATPTTSAAPILPGAWLGILGGGQLGRMACHAAQQMGYRTLVLDPDPQSPAGFIAHQHLRAAYDDAAALATMAKTCQAVSTEFENVPARSLAYLARHQRVAPSAECVAIAQDRAAEKAHFARSGIATAPYMLINSQADVDELDFTLFPAILKTARLGYDGKSQCTVNSATDFVKAWDTLQNQPCVLENRLALDHELSVIIARGQDGSLVHLPVQRNTHRNGILALTEVTDQAIPVNVAQRALSATQAIAAQLGYVGVLCLEFFVLQDGSLVANEMAPRPHNSGHYSIEACSVSQFELQIRTLCGLPLTQPVQYSPACMLNILGDVWWPNGQNTMQTPPWDKLLALPGVHLHLYSKHQARLGRKMGHVTITATSAAELDTTRQAAASVLGLPPC